MICNIFGNVDWNYYHQKPQTWYTSMKIFFNKYDILYTVEKGLGKCFSMVNYVEYKNNWTNSNHIKLDSANKEKIYCDDDGEYGIFCHVCVKIAKDRY